MPRPEILEKTYQSFSENIDGIDFKKCTLYLNIDSFPNFAHEDRKEEVVKSAQRYFGTVIPNFSGKSNFSSAVKWCFSQPKTMYTFHIEDDWEMLNKISIKVINQFFISPIVQQVALRAYRSSLPKFCLSPSIFKTAFCNTISMSLSENENPEEQIRKMSATQRRNFIVYYPIESKKVVLKDIGRNWLYNSEFSRGGKNFNSWYTHQVGTQKEVMDDQNKQLPSRTAPVRNKKYKAINNYVDRYEKSRQNKSRNRK